MELGDLHKLVDLQAFLHKRKDKKLIIFGAGDYGHRTHVALEALGFHEAYFVDNKVSAGEKRRFCGKAVRPFADLLEEDKDACLVLIAVREQHYEIEQQLLAEGFHHNRHFVCIVDYLDGWYYYDAPKDVRPVAHPNPYTKEELKERFCPNAFTQYQLNRGRAQVCCSIYIKNVFFDPLNADNVFKLWNSFGFQKVRQGVLDGTFACCDEVICPAIASRQLPKRSEITDPYLKEIMEKGLTDLPRGPRFINFSFENSCNLRCKMCRGEFHHESDAEEVEELAKALENHTFADLESMVVNGSGEFLVSKHFMKLLDCETVSKRFPKLKRIEFQSNANLFDESAWKKLEHLSEKYEIWLAISLDACHEDTYDRIRIGGNFQQLLKNLAMLTRLRDAGKVTYLRYNFCVQRENFREIRDFIDFAEAHHADNTWFQVLRGNNDPGACVHLPGHVYYEEFCKQILDPRCKQPNINISQFRDYVAFPGNLEEWMSYDIAEQKAFH